jgi:flagellin
MTMNSISTNAQALIALQNLNTTNSQMSITQKRVSTGYRVADAKDDGGAFAVAQAVRSDVAGVIAVGEQLGGTKGILQTSFAALSVVSDTMKQIRAALTRLADGAISADQRQTYEEQYELLTGQVASFIDDAFYNGRTLLSTDLSKGGGDITAIRNESGGTFAIEAVDGQLMKLAPDAFEFTADDLEELTEQAEAKYTAALPDGGTEWDDLTDDERNPYITTEIFKEKVSRATAAVQSGGAFDTADRLISSALNQFGSSMAFVDNQIKYNSQKVDAMEGGLGALVDADLAKESSTLEALKVRQQLGVQTLGLANQGPQVLLGLFR